MSTLLSTAMIIKNCEDAKLDEITSCLNGREVGVTTLAARLEAYEFLTAKEDTSKPKNIVPDFDEFKMNTAAVKKKTKRRRAYSEDNAFPFDANGFRKLRAQSLDDLHQSKDYIIKRLVQLLNELFPDYDFALSKPSQYVVHSMQTCMRNVNSHLAEVTVGDPLFLQRMWNAINDAVDVSNCEVFAYVPSDIGDGPFADGLWAFNYFFYNEDIQRLCFFCCKAQIMALNESMNVFEDEDEDRQDSDSAYDMDMSDEEDSAL